MITDLTSSNFNRVVQQPGIVMVDCWAPWCGACRQFEKTYSRVAEKYSRHTFTKVDTESNKDLRSALGISHLPSLLIYRDGVLLFNEPGNFDEQTLDGLIAQAEAMDMDMVRAELQENESESRVAKN